MIVACFIGWSDPDLFGVYCDCAEKKEGESALWTTEIIALLTQGARQILFWYPQMKVLTATLFAKSCGVGSQLKHENDAASIYCTYL